MLTDQLFTGQRDVGLGIYHYEARFYSPKLGRFLSPDTIVPGAANPQAWNRYSYTLNNPVRYTDPTGHYCVGDDEDCADEGGYGPAPSSGGGGNGGGGGGGNPHDDDDIDPNPNQLPGLPSELSSCDGPNPSVVCADQSYLGTSYTITNSAYPITGGNISAEDKMMAEITGVWWVDLIILAHDLVSIADGSDWIARYITKEDAFAIVNYESHKGEFGNYSLVTDFTVVNRTNSPIAVESFTTELYTGEVTSSFFIPPNSSGNITITPNPVIAYSINIYLSGGMKLSANISP